MSTLEYWHQWRSRKLEWCRTKLFSCEEGTSKIFSQIFNWSSVINLQREANPKKSFNWNSKRHENTSKYPDVTKMRKKIFFFMARIWSYLKGYMMYGKRTVKTKLLALRPLKLKMVSYWYWGSRGTCKNSWCHHKQWRLYHSKPELAAAGGNSPDSNKKNIFFCK